MATFDNPFAAPAQDASRVPVQTVSSLLGMRSRFAVGRRVVEVESGHWNGLEVYRVDGEERVRKRNLGWHSLTAFEVEGRRVEVRGRWYPVLPITVDVDGARQIDDLFPQRFGLVGLIATVSLLAMGVLTASIALDLWRWLHLG